MTSRDFPFLFDGYCSGLDGLPARIYRALVKMNGDDHFVCVEDLLDFLKGKEAYDLLCHRGFGRQSLKVLREWVNHQLEGDVEARL